MPWTEEKLKGLVKKAEEKDGKLVYEFEVEVPQSEIERLEKESAKWADGVVSLWEVILDGLQGGVDRYLAIVRPTRD